MPRHTHFQNRRGCRLWLTCALTLLLLTGSAFAQTTAFTYQGKLADSGSPANGSYDLQFKLFDTVTVGTGTQQGSAITVSNVTVTNGIFTVQLDFGACVSCFNGAARYLEIAVKPTSGGTFTTLGPRQPFTSAPYAIKSLNATTADNALQLNGLSSSGFILNGTAQQASTSFNVSGDGTAGGTLSGSIVNAVTQYNLNGLRAFAVSGPFNNGAGLSFTASNTFTGDGAGLNTTPSPTVGDSTGKFNSFFGAGAGQANTTGDSNSLFGVQAGYANTSGFQNAFFGVQAGFRNTTGNGNAFFGFIAGNSNTTGIHNTFFGGGAGLANTTGSQNAFFGTSSGNQNTSGIRNSFFGDQTGTQNTTGNLNTFVGVAADFAGTNTTGSSNTLLGSFSLVLPNLTNATGIGANTYVTQSNSLILGSINGVGAGTADTNVGIGTTAPAQRLHVVGNGIFTGNLTVNGTLIANIPAGSANYIQNGSSQQASSNFNISGSGTAGGTLTGNIINAVTQVNINGQRAFTVNGPFDNGAPVAATNTFTGDSAGLNTTPDPTPNGLSGKFNSFYGAIAGRANATGFRNAFFGFEAGYSNITGQENAYFGVLAGGNDSGRNNAYFGYSTGLNSIASFNNAFFGSGADFSGGSNAGNNNTLLGALTKVTANLTNATAVGALASVTQSNSLVLGSINAINGATADTSVGIGTTAPAARLHVVGNWNGQHGALTLQGDKPTIRFSGGAAASFEQWMLHLGSDGPGGSLEFFNGGSTGVWTPILTMTRGGAVGIGTSTPADTLQVVGNLRVGFGTNGCVKDADGTVIAGTCSSDVRLKRDILPFAHLLDKVAQLQPVTFHWRAEEFKDRHFGTRQSYGLIAQEVEKVLPELVTEDEHGYKAVNYSKLPLLSIQAIKELKAENDALKQKLDEQQQELAAIKQLLCLTQPQAELCKAKSVK